MTAPHDHPLELTPAEMRALVDSAMDRIEAFTASLPEQPMHATAGKNKLARSLRAPLPEQGTPAEKLLDLLFKRVIPASLNAASPGYLAYVPGGGIFHSALADLITASTNRYIGTFECAPGLVQLEANVIAWFAAMLGLPDTAGGLLTSGGSLANFGAVVTARRERLPPDFLRGVVYASDDAHHSVRKAVMLAGFDPGAVRAIPVDERGGLPPAAVAEAIAADRARGLAPFFLVASAGTTATGTIDDLPALADLAEKERLWFHVDAAYGGFFALTDRGRAALRGVDRADSVTLDPHKGLFLPYGTGCLLVRDREALRRAHAVPAAYLPPMQSDGEFPDFCELGPELSREMRGLRVWLPLQMHGAAAFRAELDEKIDLARRAAAALSAMPGIELFSEPDLSLFAFRARRPGLEGEALDAFNRRVLSGVNARQRVLLSGAPVRGRFALRICVLCFRTHASHIDFAIEDIAASLADADRAEEA